MTDLPPPAPPSLSRSLFTLTDSLRTLIRQRLWAQVMIAMVLGIGTGLALSPGTGLVDPATGPRIAMWLALPGSLFLAAVKFIVVPLVVASVVRGIVAGGDPANVRRLGLRAVAFFLATTVIAVIIGFAVTGIIQPGAVIDSAALGLADAVPPPAAGAASAFDPGVLPEKIVAFIPVNPFATLAEGEMLQVVIVSVMLGLGLMMIEASQAKPLLDLLAGLQAITMAAVGFFMRFAPIAVFGLLAQLATRVGLDAILGMAVYVGTVLGALFVLVLVYVLLVVVLGRRSPLAFLGQVREVLLLAFSTSSSAAVMPLSMKTAEDRLKVAPAISRFVVPLGTTVNMGGTALYQGAAALFLAQVFGIDIGIAGMTLILITAVGASIGSPGAPGIGIVILTSILVSAGIPEAGVALLIGVDRILDMARTAVNVLGDLVACVVLDRFERRRDPPAAPAADADDAEAAS